MKRIVAIALALVTAVCLSGCGGGSGSTAKAGAPATLKVGVLPIANLAPFYVAIQRGYFKKQHLNVKPVVQQGGSEVVASLVSGSLQVGWSASTGTVISADQGIPLKVVAPGTSGPTSLAHYNNPIMVSANSPIKKPADLIGKTIAVNTVANLADITIRAALDKMGLDSSKVKFLEIPFPQMAAALKKGSVDAVDESEPFATQLSQQGGRIIFDSFLDTRPGMPTGHWTAMGPYYEKHKDVIKRFYTAIDEANAYSNTHPEAVQKAIASYTQIPPAVLSKIQMPTWATSVDMSGLQTVTDITRKYGPKGLKPIKPSDFVIPELQ